MLTLRVGEWDVEIAALGDSTAVIGHPGGTTTRITDDRLQRVSTELRQGYRDELRRGSGFGQEHRARLRELQRSETPQRN